MNTPHLPPHAKRVFKGVIYDIYQWEQEMFDGTTAIFEKLQRSDTATIIPVVGDKIMLIEQQQPGTEPYLCFPGGRCDEGEEPLQTAQRELSEETGYTSTQWEFLQSLTPSSHMIWTLHTYIARDCTKTAELQLDGGEKITPLLITFDEMLQLPDDERFNERHLIQLLYRCRLDTTIRERLRSQLWS